MPNAIAFVSWPGQTDVFPFYNFIDEMIPIPGFEDRPRELENPKPIHSYAWIG